MLIYSLAIWHYELKTNAHAKACTQIVIAAFFIIIKNRETTKMSFTAAAAAAKLLQSCPTLCDPIDGSPPGSPVPGILQARTLEWGAISFSSAWKRKVKVKSLVSDSSRPHGLQPTRLLRPWDFPGKSAGVGCHCLLRDLPILGIKSVSLAMQGEFLMTGPPGKPLNTLLTRGFL